MDAAYKNLLSDSIGREQRQLLTTDVAPFRRMARAAALSPSARCLTLNVVSAGRSVVVSCIVFLVHQTLPRTVPIDGIRHGLIRGEISPACFTSLQNVPPSRSSNPTGSTLLSFCTRDAMHPTHTMNYSPLPTNDRRCESHDPRVCQTALFSNDTVSSKPAQGFCCARRMRDRMLTRGEVALASFWLDNEYAHGR